eukprot:799556_1
MKRGAGGPILRIGGDYVAGSMDKVVFAPNMSRGVMKNPLRNIDDELMNILNPQQGGSGGAKMNLKQYYSVLFDAGFEDNASICTLAKQKLDELGVKKLFHQRELLRRVEELKQCTDVIEMEEDKHVNESGNDVEEEQVEEKEKEEATL